MTRARDLANLGSNPPLSAGLGGPGPVSLGTVTAKASFEDVGSLLVAGSDYWNGNAGDTVTIYWAKNSGNFSEAFLAHFQKDSGTIQFKAGTTVYTFNVIAQPYGTAPNYIFLQGTWTGSVYSGNLDIYPVSTGTALTISNPDGVTVPADLSKVYINGTAYTDILDVNNTTIRFTGPDIYSVGGSVSIYGSNEFLTGYDRDGNVARTLSFDSDTEEFVTPTGTLAEARRPTAITSAWDFSRAAGASTTKVSDPITVSRPSPSRSGRAIIYGMCNTYLTTSANSRASVNARLDWAPVGGSVWFSGPQIVLGTTTSSNILTAKDITMPYVWYLDSLPQGDIQLRIVHGVDVASAASAARFSYLYITEL